jgi:hypothetical protein
VVGLGDGDESPEAAPPAPRWFAPTSAPCIVLGKRGPYLGFLLACFFTGLIGAPRPWWRGRW